MAFTSGQPCGSTELPRQHTVLEGLTGGAWAREKSKELRRDLGLWMPFAPQLSPGASTLPLPLLWD